MKRMRPLMILMKQFLMVYEANEAADGVRFLVLLIFIISFFKLQTKSFLIDALIKS